MIFSWATGGDELSLLLVSREGNLRPRQRNFSACWHIAGQMKKTCTSADILVYALADRLPTTNSSCAKASHYEVSGSSRNANPGERRCAGGAGRESCMEGDTDRAAGRGHGARSGVAKLNKATVAGQRQRIYYRRGEAASVFPVSSRGKYTFLAYI